MQWTKETVVERIQARHRDDRPLNSAAVRADEAALWGASQRLWGSWANAVAAAGLDVSVVAQRRYPSGRRSAHQWTAELVLIRIRERRATGLSLASGRVARDDCPLWRQGRLQFGSWPAAIAAAGIDYASIRISGRCAPPEPVQELQTCRRTGRPVPLGFWADADTARTILRYVLDSESVPFSQAPAHCSRRWFTAHRLDTLLRRYDNSPAALFTTLFPKSFAADMFAVKGSEPSPRITARAARITCTRCSRWFSPARVYATAAKFCPYCGFKLPAKETPE